jgi:hypothetical protein
VGVFEPKISHATIPLPRLQAQLVDGRKIALGKTAELYGFCEGVQLSIKLSHLNEEERRMEAELSLDQTERYQVWRESLLDRLLVLGARGFSLHEVTAIIEHA